MFSECKELYVEETSRNLKKGEHASIKRFQIQKHIQFFSFT